MPCEQNENEQYLMKEILNREDFTGPLGEERYDLLAKIAIRFRHLIAGLDSRDPDIRRNAVKLLSKYGDHHVMNYLKSIQRDDKNVLRHFARQEMDKIRNTLDLLPPLEIQERRETGLIAGRIAMLAARITPGSLLFFFVGIIVLWIIIFLVIYLH